MTELKTIEGEISPFSPHRNEPFDFEVKGVKFSVVRPRARVVLECQRIAQVLMGDTAGLVVADHSMDFLCEAMAFLPSILKEAPAHWKGDKGEFSLEDVVLEEVGAVWVAIVKHWPGRFSRFSVDPTE